MSNEAFRNLIQSLEAIRQQLNRDAMQLGKQGPIFQEIYSVPLNYTCYEAGFLRMISWLYMLYYEAGQGEITFLVDKFDTYNIDQDQRSRNHYKDLDILRTTFQHNMDLDKAKGPKYKQRSDEWFRRSIQQEFPLTAQDWQKCFETVVNDAIFFLGNFSTLITLIGGDEFLNSIVDEWNSRSSRIHHPHEYDRIIEAVALEFGMRNFDFVKFRKQNFEGWSRELQFKNGNYDFQREARKLIERDIIKKPVLPITGTDIMEKFSVPPGRLVKEILELAWQIYNDKPCTKEELLNRLDEAISRKLANGD